MTKTSSPAWLAESVRITLFCLVIPPPPTATNLWRRIADAEPEETSSRPALGLHQVHGPFAGGRFSASATQGRLDLVLSAEPQLFDPFTQSTLGRYKSAVETLVERSEFIVEDLPPVHRIALGAVLLQPASERAAGYRTLVPFLPALQIEAETSSDFSYQINRPRASRVNPDLVLNRLSKWSVQMTAAMVAVAGVSAALGADRKFAARLEADVSTPADHGGEIPPEKIMEFFNELKELIFELAEKGDVR